MKRTLLAIVAVFVAWTVMDFVIHGVILQSAYNATAQLWRPMNEMKMGVLHLSVLVAAIAFVCIYVGFFARKGVKNGAEYGFWFGLATGTSMGFGTYSVMPIPFEMALVWFLGRLAEALVAGVIAGLVVKE